MLIRIKPSAPLETKWYEYAVRFLFGGVVTAMAGIIGKEYGPVVGGLFLAFPAIFPASATLVEKHERQRKENHGLHGKKRGEQAASVDAAGAALGSIALACFGLMVWWLATRTSPWVVLAAATCVWTATSYIIWRIRKKI
jgi:hypothetical protein